MSVYNYNNKTGLLKRVKKEDEDNIDKFLDIKEYLIEYNQYTKFKYNDVIQLKIQEIEFNNLLKKYNNLDINDKEKYKEEAKAIKTHKYYKKYVKDLGIFGKIKNFIKINLYSISKMHLRLKNKRSK